jgi:hypothetical protein
LVLLEKVLKLELLTAQDRRAFSIDPIVIVQCELSARAFQISHHKNANEKFEPSQCCSVSLHTFRCRAIARDTLFENDFSFDTRTRRPSWRN